MSQRRGLVLAIFILSGAAALIDEIVWSRQLVLVFGNTTQALSAILTGFFGGIAIGSAVGGRIADRVHAPLRMYGILELVLAAVVLATPISFGLIGDLYQGVYPSLEGLPLALALLRVVLAVFALAPATILMGATLPTLTRHLTRTTDLSASFSRLYAANTVGAIVGTEVAGFVLIELLGLSGALAVGAAFSGVAGAAAFLLSRGHAPTLPRPASAAIGSIRRAPQLALTVAFISGLTSLGYQVTWTRLLASGTGNTTYVFTVILSTFLIGLALGALIFSTVRSRIGDPIRLLAGSQIVGAALAVAGLALVIVAPDVPDPGDPLGALRTLFGRSALTVLPVTVMLGIAFPASSALLPDDAEHAGQGSGSLLASNTIGAIAGSLIVPFFLIPVFGSPLLVALLALTNASVGVVLAWRLVTGWSRRLLTASGTVAAIVVLAVAVSPGLLVQPTEAHVAAGGGRIFESTEDEIASVQAGQISSTPQLWVAGTSMTLLTVDAKLMPILPLIARPDSENALVVAFGMGSAYRAALIAGLRTDGVELVPSVPDMFVWYYDDAADVLADPNGRVIIADGRNHLELTDERFDIIVTDPPPPIESSGAAVISSYEYYVAGRDHLTDGGIMMQWVPYGAPVLEFLEHIRTFASVFPEVAVVKGAGGYGVYMLGSSEPIAFAESDIRAILARPGVLTDISTAFDSPAKTVDDWVTVIARQTWLTGGDVLATAGRGPLITDDRPRPEYFLLRRVLGLGS